MKKFLYFAHLSLFLVSLWATNSPTNKYLTLKDIPAIKPHQFADLAELGEGSILYGMTRMSHNRMHYFKIEVIKLMHSKPQGTAILGLAEDDLLAETGVLQGMSGSPVYYEGRLVGAVSFTQGFLKKPILGITPIQEMLELRKFGDREVTDKYQRLSSQSKNFNFSRKNLSELVTNLSKLGGGLGKKVKIQDYTSWLASRLVPSGLEGNVVQSKIGSQAYNDSLKPYKLGQIKKQFQDIFNQDFNVPFGFTPVGLNFSLSGEDNGVKGGLANYNKTNLEPGDMVGVELVRGDVSFAGFGTVTYVTNDKVFAFGHPMSGFGRSSLPVYTAYNHGVVPSQVVSYKVSSLGKEVGTLVEDRHSAIMIDQGKQAPMVPLKVTLDSPINHRVFNYEVTADPHYTSSLVMDLVMYSLSLYENKTESLEYEIKINTPRGSIKFKDLVSTSGRYNRRVNGLAMSFLAISLENILNILDNNGFGRVPVTSLEVSARMSIKERVLVIDEVSWDKEKYQAGDTVNYEVMFLEYGKEGSRIRKKGTFKLPKHLPVGSYVLRIGNERELRVEEMVASYALLYAPNNTDELIKLLNLPFRGNFLSMWLVMPKPIIRQGKNFYKNLPDNQARFLSGVKQSKKDLVIDFKSVSREMDYSLVGSSEIEIKIIK